MHPLLKFFQALSTPRAIQFMVSAGVAWMALICAAPAAAHAKWFADGKENHDVAPYALSDGDVQIWVALVAAAIAAALLIERGPRMPVPAWLAHAAESYAGQLRRFAQLVLGISLFTLATRGHLLAPSLGGKPEEGFWLLLLTQAAVGCMLIADEMPKLAAGLLAALAVAVGVSSGPVAPLEAAHVLALAVYFFMASQQHGGHRAVWLLRMGLGISFCTAAFSEKLLDPALGMHFLARIDMNFMKHIGFDYGDRLFVLSAGMSELLLGFLLMAGLASRMIACVLTSLLVTSNAYLLLIGLHDEALIELIGHSPILVALIIVVIYGKGSWKIPALDMFEFQEIRRRAHSKSDETYSIRS